jgi:hypothetical protein
MKKLYDCVVELLGYGDGKLAMLRMSEEIDKMNRRISELENQLENGKKI